MSGNNDVEYFVLSACIVDTPGNTGVIVDELDKAREIYDHTGKAFVSKGFQSFGMEEVPTFSESSGIRFSAPPPQNYLIMSAL
jgi:hypothetical protein